MSALTRSPYFVWAMASVIYAYHYTWDEMVQTFPEYPKEIAAAKKMYDEWVGMYGEYHGY